MTPESPDAATLAALVRDCPLLDEASREYWLDLLPALDAGQRQRLAELLTSAPAAAADEDTDSEGSSIPDRAAGR